MDTHTSAFIIIVIIIYRRAQWVLKEMKRLYHILLIHLPLTVDKTNVFDLIV